MSQPRVIRIGQAPTVARADGVEPPSWRGGGIALRK